MDWEGKNKMKEVEREMETCENNEHKKMPSLTCE